MSPWSTDNDVVRFDDCRAIRAAQKALLVEIPDLGDELWIEVDQGFDPLTLHGVIETVCRNGKR